jgi:hypothetical protein
MQSSDWQHQLGTVLSSLLLCCALYPLATSVAAQVPVHLTVDHTSVVLDHATTDHSSMVLDPTLTPKVVHKSERMAPVCSGNSSGTAWVQVRCLQLAAARCCAC